MSAQQANELVEKIINQSSGQWLLNNKKNVLRYETNPSEKTTSDDISVDLITAEYIGNNILYIELKDVEDMTYRFSTRVLNIAQPNRFVTKSFI